MVRHREMLERDPGRVPDLAVDRAGAARIFRRAAADGREHLNLDEARRQLSNALSILERYPGDEVVRESDGTTVAALKRMNKLRSDNIRIGQKLRVR